MKPCVFLINSPSRSPFFLFWPTGSRRWLTDKSKPQWSEKYQAKLIDWCLRMSHALRYSGAGGRSRWFNNFSRRGLVKVWVSEVSILFSGMLDVAGLPSSHRPPRWGLISILVFPEVSHVESMVGIRTHWQMIG